MSSEPDREAIEKAQKVLFDEGMKIREQVLGTAHVQNSRSLPPLQQPVQSLAVSAGWSLCWTRPGLEKKTRSLITVSLLTALGQDHELGAHVKGAINNGCTPEEIMEAIYQVRNLVRAYSVHLMLTSDQTGVYAGVPCALNASRIANATIESLQ